MTNQTSLAVARLRQKGFSLIELMIAMVIGLVVIGAVIASYLGTGVSGRHGRALSQITEDASIALSVLRSGINMVGYGAPTGIDVNGRFTKNYTQSGLFGCDSDFADPSFAIDALTCNGAGGIDSIAVAYEADEHNSVVNGANVPLDCLGNALDMGGNPYYLNYSRYYVNNNQLFCRGPGSGTPAALVDNVVDLQIRYGVSNRVEGSPDTYRVARYMTATEMGAVPGNADWTNTVSVRICVVVRSTENVLDQSTEYQGCAGAVTPASDDRRMYRAFTTTVVLQNRLGAVL